MNSLSRRNFLSKSATGLAVAGVSASITKSAWAQPMGANGDIRIAIVGLGIKGNGHLDVLSELKGVRVVALCDVDQARLDETFDKFQDTWKNIRKYRDLRILLEDDDIDAVVIATPNHWHTLMALWASQAGKDIYLEKPVSHDIWEGHRLLEIEQKYGRIIQGGTQNRSNAGFKEGLEYMRTGVFGKILWVHGIDFKFRRSMGRRRGPQRVPNTVDYNLFCGPVPVEPLCRSKLHYDWHWQWVTGNGDMGNIAVHVVDNLRHIVGDDRQPDRVRSLGGRFVYDDDGETPNVHLAQFDYSGLPVFSEIRTIAIKPGATVTDNLRGSRQTSIVQCEGGYMSMGQSGAAAYSNDGKRIKAFSASGVKDHMQNFVDAVRDQNAKLINCPTKVAVQAAEMCHLANLSYRSGNPAPVDEIKEAMNHVTHGRDAVTNIEENLDRLGVNLSKDNLTLGSWMSLENGGRSLKVHDPDCKLIAQSLFRKRPYRKPFVLPNSI